MLLRRELRLQLPGAVRGVAGEPQIQDWPVHHQRPGAPEVLALLLCGAEVGRQGRAVEKAEVRVRSVGKSCSQGSPGRASCRRPSVWKAWKVVRSAWGWRQPREGAGCGGRRGWPRGLRCRGPCPGWPRQWRRCWCGRVLLRCPVLSSLQTVPLSGAQLRKGGVEEFPRTKWKQPRGSRTWHLAAETNDRKERRLHSGIFSISMVYT